MRARMMKRVVLTSLFAATMASAVEPTPGEEATDRQAPATPQKAGEAPKEGASIDPRADATLKRMSILPDVPPIADTVPGFEVVHWYGMWAPKGTPQAIVKLWNAEVARVLKSPQMARQMTNEGLSPAGGPPQEFYELNKAAIQKWRRVIKEAKLGSSQ